LDDDGKIVERWDVLQFVPDEACNPNGMFWSLIPKSCRLFGRDHAPNQTPQSAIRFNLNGKRSNEGWGVRRPCAV
jgi:hypothetical protein